MKQNDPQSRMNKALLVLEQSGLTQKQVAEACSIPESNLSTKRKKYTKPSDKDLLKIEETFSLQWAQEEYAAINDAETIRLIHYKLHGKEAAFFNTKWYVYFWDKRMGIGRALLEIKDKQHVFFTNIPFTDNRIRDYSGTFIADEGKRIIICTLLDKLTSEKHLHIKMNAGQGTTPILCLGHYSNIHETGALVAGHMVFELVKDHSTILPTAFFTENEDCSELPPAIKLFFSREENRMIKLPPTNIQSYEQLEEWLQQ